MADENFAVVIARDMRNLTPETRKAVRPKLRQAGQLVANDAKQRASWSSRIPSSIRVRTSFRENRENVKVLAGDSNSPHARPYEGLGVRGATFRHPVYGNRDNWVSQETRPFLFPAAEANQVAAADLISSALTDAAIAIGFS
jgi:hypothetical protein